MLLNQGDGSLAAAVSYSSGGFRPFGVATADFDGDGEADVVVVNQNSNTISVLLNKGTGNSLAVAVEAMSLLVLPPGATVAALATFLPCYLFYCFTSTILSQVR